MISIVQGVGLWLVFLPGLGAHRLTISILGLEWQAARPLRSCSIGVIEQRLAR
jgi:hypothetical protein